MKVRMSKKSKNLVTLNHLPGILLASEAECERWVEAGLIPVAERRTFQKRGRKFDAPMFDPDAVAELASKVPGWRAQQGGMPEASRRDGADQPPDEAAYRRRQNILAPVRRNTGLYVAEDIRKIESGRWKPERVFAGYRAVFGMPMQILPDSAPIDIAIEYAFAEPPEVAAVALSPARVGQAELASASAVLEAKLVEVRDATFAACEQELAGWRDELETYLDAFEDADERNAILGGIRSALDRLDRIHASDKGGPAGAGRKLRQKLDEYRSKAATRRLRHLREAQIREASGYERYAASGEINSTVGDQADRVAAVREVFGARPGTAFDELDGLTVTLADGAWFNLRASNTEPLLRLNVEAADADAVAVLRDEVLAIVRA